MKTSYLRGHQIEFINNEWVFSDTLEPTAETHKSRACGNCGKMETAEGHDACLGNLPGVINACCGHGIILQAYIQFLNGTELRGSDAIIKQKQMKKDEELSEKMIKEMQDAGLSPDEMLDVIKLAREKYNLMQKFDCNHPAPFCSDNYNGHCQSKVGCNFKTKA